jgi:phosphate transport system protein
MAVHMQRDLDRLRRDLLALAGLVEAALHKGIQALGERNVELAREVIAGDEQIDDEENLVYEECLKILALHQPVAGDLRRIITAMMITTDLERIGDLAEEIAERAVALARPPYFPVPDKVQHMTDLITVMVRQSLDSFVNLDRHLAGVVIRMDDQVDALNTEIINSLIEIMKAQPELVEGGLSMFSVVRHLERIADHATNICEDVIYLIDGELIRHKPPPELD